MSDTEAVDATTVYSRNDSSWEPASTDTELIDDLWSCICQVRSRHMYHDHCTHYFICTMIIIQVISCIPVTSCLKVLSIKGPRLVQRTSLVSLQNRMPEYFSCQISTISHFARCLPRSCVSLRFVKIPRFAHTIT